MKTSKLVSLLLVVVLCLSVLAVSAFAATTEGEGLKLTLTTDKAEYTAADKITATLKVENTSDAALSNLNLAIAAPTGYGAENTASKTVESLAAGASEELAVTFSAKAPNTGDNMMIAVVVAVVAATGVIALVGNRKAAALSLALVMVLGLAVIGLPTYAEAASDALEVSTTVKVDGADVTIKATVSAQAQTPDEPPVVTPTNVIFEETFSGSEIDTTVWTYYNGGPDKKNTIKLENGAVVMMSDQEAKQTALRLKFAEPWLVGTYTFEFDVTPTFPPHAEDASLYNENAGVLIELFGSKYENSVKNPAMNLTLQPARFMYRSQGQDNVSVYLAEEHTSGATYHIKLVASTETDECTIYCNGNLIGVAPFRYGDAEELYEIRIGTSAHAGVTVILDNVKVTKES